LIIAHRSIMCNPRPVHLKRKSDRMHFDQEPIDAALWSANTPEKQYKNEVATQSRDRLP